MYKKALQEGYLYKTSKGMVSTQDLFGMPLKGAYSLNSVAITISKDIKADGEESFVDTKGSDPINNAKLDIVKDIIADRLKAKLDASNAKDKAEKKAKLLSILSRKQDASDEAKTEAEILAELEALG